MYVCKKKIEPGGVLNVDGDSGRDDVLSKFGNEI